MSVSFKDNRKNFDEKISLIEKLSNSYVLVGFQEGSVTRAQVKGNRAKKAGLSMPQIAAQNEFGTDIIPARPFMVPAIAENNTKVTNAIRNEYDKIILGNSTIKRSLGLIGNFAVNLIKLKIRSIRYPPNAPSTIRRKKSSKPLIDFGQMIQSVTYKVVS